MEIEKEKNKGPFIIYTTANSLLSLSFCSSCVSSLTLLLSWESGGRWMTTKGDDGGKAKKILPLYECANNEKTLFITTTTFTKKN